MTNEQILQKAEQHVKELSLHGDSRYYEMNGFVAGAHSRDEEVDELQGKVEAMESYIEAEKACMQEELYEMQEQLKMNAEGFQRLRAELNEAQNPWRKVEKELPSEDTEVVTYLRGTMVIGYRIGERWYMHGIAIDTPDYWMPMPMPQAPKGGEK